MDDLSNSLAELGEMIDRQNARIATLEAERDAANLRANGLQEIATRAEADLARKQEIINYIDCATMFLTDETAKAVAALIRPEATAKGDFVPTPRGHAKPKLQLEAITRPEPSGEKALRLVAQVASIVADPYIDAAEKRAQLDAIASEARGGAE